MGVEWEVVGGGKPVGSIPSGRGCSGRGMLFTGFNIVNSFRSGSSMVRADFASCFKHEFSSAVG